MVIFTKPRWRVNKSGAAAAMEPVNFLETGWVMLYFDGLLPDGCARAVIMTVFTFA
jgi:hypothetical protein